MSAVSPPIVSNTVWRVQIKILEVFVLTRDCLTRETPLEVYLIKIMHQWLEYNTKDKKTKMVQFSNALKMRKMGANTLDNLKLFMELVITNQLNHVAVFLRSRESKKWDKEMVKCGGDQVRFMMVSGLMTWCMEKES